MEKQELLRRIPKVDELLVAEELQPLLKIHPREVVVEGIRNGLDRVRQDLLAEPPPEEVEEATTPARLALVVQEEIHKRLTPHLTRVINATGVILHTNLGRAPLSTLALQHLLDIAEGYSNLEYDLDRGVRGSRYSHVEGLLVELSGAEAGMVVNNNAGAVLLTLNTLAAGREVIVSRGELVEIGGGFRIPEVMARSGATLREVGTTNRTHLRDYQHAVNERTALLLKVHTSNYRVLGFTSEIGLETLV
jgi:L-seryl-tRNA(Ser) seleniumtransferase